MWWVLRAMMLSFKLQTCSHFSDDWILFSRLSLSTFSLDQVTHFIEYFNRRSNCDTSLLPVFRFSSSSTPLTLGDLMHHLEIIFLDVLSSKKWSWSRGLLTQCWWDLLMFIWTWNNLNKIECDETEAVFILRKLEGFTIRLIDIYCVVSSGQHKASHSWTSE